MPEIFHFWIDCVVHGLSVGNGVFAAVEIIFVLIWLFYRKKGGDEVIKRKEEKVKQLAKYAFLVIFIGSTIFYAPFHKYQDAIRQSESDFVERVRPVLEPSLTVDFNGTNGVIYHFDVENKGKLTAYNIRWEQAGVDSFEIISTNLISNQLEPGQTISISSNIPIPVPKDGFHPRLTLFYDGSEKGRTKSFQTSHLFNLNPLLVKAGVTASQIAAYPNTNHSFEATAQDFGKKMESQFDLPTGTISFWLTTSNKGEFPTIRLVGSNRFFEFNEFTRTAKFISGGASDKPLQLEKKIRPKNYFVLLSWTTNSAMMAIDDEIITNTVPGGN